MKVFLVLLLIACIAIIDAKFKGFSKKQLSRHTLGRITRETQSEELTPEDVAALEIFFDKKEEDCGFHDCVDEEQVRAHCDDGEWVNLVSYNMGEKWVNSPIQSAFLDHLLSAKRCLWLYANVVKALLEEVDEELKESEHGDRRRR